jgi:hypothetical protein
LLGLGSNATASTNVVVDEEALQMAVRGKVVVEVVKTTTPRRMTTTATGSSNDSRVSANDGGHDGGNALRLLRPASATSSKDASTTTA